MLLRAKHIKFLRQKIRISLLIRPLKISADKLLSCLSPLISVAASHFPWICDVTRAVRPMTVY